MPSRRAEPADGLIWVEDRHGTGLPYSKGLMAASIMATGLPPARAYELAALIEGELRELAVTRLCAESLVGAAAAILARHEGADVADRYLAWRQAKRAARPTVVLIGGATGVGKSTVATKLAARLDLPKVIPTDAVRQVMRSLLPVERAPEIHRSSFEGGPDPLEGFMTQARTVASGVAGLIERTVVERTDLILEGVHLVPGLLQEPKIARLRAQAAVVQVLLVIERLRAHRSHFLHRLDNAHGRDPIRYLSKLGEIRRIQDHLMGLALRHGVPVVEAVDLDGAIQSVIDLVVAEVTTVEARAAVG